MSGSFWKKRAKAFVYAWHGLKSLIKEEHNARIHVVAAIVAIVVGCCVDLSPMEWCVILICIGMVVSAEAMNSAVEALADRITRDFDPIIGKAKDYGAAAVTILAVVAAVVGLIVFIPKIINLFIC